MFDVAAGADADLSIFANHDLHVVPDNATLTFAHSYTWWGTSCSLIGICNDMQIQGTSVFCT